MDFTKFCASGTKYSHRYISGENDVKLFLIHFKPKIKSNFPPVIFIPGWGSIIDSWEVVLKEMTKDFEVYYLETREKSSSIHVTERILTINSLGDDLPNVLSELNLINKSIQNFRNLIPPIFHFTKDKVGQVTFNGMFIIDTLREQKFFHKGYEIDNYKVKLKKLDEEEIHLSWINYRSGASSIDQINQANTMDKIPHVWINYINGEVN